MTTHNSIPFSATVPTEPGVYLWKYREDHVGVLIELFGQPGKNQSQVVGNKLFDAPTEGLYSCKLIPSTDVLNLQKQIDLDSGNIARMQEAGDRLTVERDELKAKFYELAEDHLKAQRAVKGLLIAYRPHLQGNWYESMAAECGMPLDAIGFIKEPELRKL